MACCRSPVVEAKLSEHIISQLTSAPISRWSPQSCTSIIGSIMSTPLASIPPRGYYHWATDVVFAVVLGRQKSRPHLLRVRAFTQAFEPTKKTLKPTTELHSRTRPTAAAMATSKIEVNAFSDLLKRIVTREKYGSNCVYISHLICQNQ